MLDALTAALPRLEVDRTRCADSLAGGALATDEVMRRVEAGRPFRLAYREVKEALARGERFDPPSPRSIIARRGSTGGLGDLGLSQARSRLRRAARWGSGQRRRFDGVMSRLAGRAVRRTTRPS